MRNFLLINKLILATALLGMNFAYFDRDYFQFITDENLERALSKRLFKLSEKHYRYNVNDSSLIVFTFSKNGLLDSVTPKSPYSSIDYLTKGHFYSYDENGFLNKEKFLLNNGDSIINNYKFKIEGDTMTLAFDSTWSYLYDEPQMLKISSDEKCQIITDNQKRILQYIYKNDRKFYHKPIDLIENYIYDRKGQIISIKRTDYLNTFDSTSYHYFKDKIKTIEYFSIDSTGKCEKYKTCSYSKGVLESESTYKIGRKTIEQLIQYSYSHKGQLIKRDCFNFSTSGEKKLQESESYSYNELGLITEKISQGYIFYNGKPDGNRFRTIFNYEFYE